MPETKAIQFPRCQEYGYNVSYNKVIVIDGRTVKSVTELLIFWHVIYGGGFLPIPTDSYSDVTFSYKLSGTWLPRSLLLAAENIMAHDGFDSSASSSTASDTRMSTDNVPVDTRDVSYCRYMFYSTFF